MIHWMNHLVSLQQEYDIGGLVQERRKSSALAMELRLYCTNPSIWREDDTNYKLCQTIQVVTLQVTTRVEYMKGDGACKVTDRALKLVGDNDSFSEWQGLALGISNIGHWWFY